MTVRRAFAAALALAALGAQGCAYPEITPAADAAAWPTAQIKHRPTCNALVERKRFHTPSKPKLSWFDRLSGALTTPFKHLSTSFDGPGAWRDTGCDAQGIGRTVRATQHSTDDLYTIDVEIVQGWVTGHCVQAGKFVRLEVLPGRPAHRALRTRRPQLNEVIAFGGPLIWDKDKRPPQFTLGHMEIHPRDPIIFLSAPPAPLQCPA
jgi:hypothetical protein